jgi:hypothetical protein
MRLGQWIVARNQPECGTYIHNVVEPRLVLRQVLGQVLREYAQLGVPPQDTLPPLKRVGAGQRVQQSGLASTVRTQEHLRGMGGQSRSIYQILSNREKGALVLVSTWPGPEKEDKNVGRRTQAPSCLEANGKGSTRKVRL